MNPDFLTFTPRRCGTCASWRCDLLSLSRHESGALEALCGRHEALSSSGKTRYSNGWRRGSDNCGEWSKRETTT